MKILISTDMHFTDQPLDAYRFDVFYWFEELIEQYDIGAVFLLGDLTDYKDNHSSRLVNRITRELSSLSSMVEEGGLHLLKGNHDFKNDPNCPFFGFLGAVRGIFYYTQQYQFTWENKTYLFLPSVKNPMNVWIDVDFNNADYVLMHQTVNGAKASNGFEIPSNLPAKFFRSKDCVVFSGDIHVPQKRGGVIYVGSPYVVRFGDEFEPRVIVLDSESGEWESIPTDICNKKFDLVVRRAKDLDDFYLVEGDQAKVTLITRSTDHEKIENIHKEISNKLRDLDVSLCGFQVRISNATETRKRKRVLRRSNIRIFQDYAEAERIEGITFEAGEECILGN